MNKITSKARKFTIALVTVGALAGVGHGAVTFVDEGGGDYRIASVTNIDIGGTLYTATGVASFGSGETLADLSATAPNTLLSGDLLLGLQDIAAQVLALNITAPITLSDEYLLALNDLTGGTGGYDEAFVRRNSLSPLSYNDASFEGNYAGGPFTAQNRVFSFGVAAIPEPSYSLLLGLGALGIVTRRRRTS